MLDVDIKTLWGRAANRCSLCRMELTPDGERLTIGQMAHIVAKKTAGPRGNDPLALADRDKYSNLILLCPNHHETIDTYPVDWPIATLKQRKAEHEHWVVNQLNSGLKAPRTIDNSEFVATRKSEWLGWSKSPVAFGISLTPLGLSSEPVEITDNRVRNLIDSIDLRYEGEKKLLQRRNTQPRIDRLVHTTKDEYGHFSVSIYRNGHCEIWCDLSNSTSQLTQYIREKHNNRFTLPSRVVRYSDLYFVVNDAADWFQQCWQSLLHYNDMTITAMVHNTAKTALLIEEDFGRPTFGPEITEADLSFSTVINTNFDPSELKLAILRRLCNGYGTILESLQLDAQGYPVAPRPF